MNISYIPIRVQVYFHQASTKSVLSSSPIILLKCISRGVVNCYGELCHVANREMYHYIVCHQTDTPFLSNDFDETH